jgi:hypothetical protein
MLKHNQCFSSLLQKDENLANIERLALVLEVQAIAGNKGECLRCKTIKSERNRVRVELKIYCPGRGVTHVWHIGIGRLLLIGTGVVHGGDVLLLAQGFGDASHLCGNLWCIRASNLFWENSLVSNERKLHHTAWNIRCPHGVKCIPRGGVSLMRIYLTTYFTLQRNIEGRILTMSQPRALATSAPWISLGMQ